MSEGAAMTVGQAARGIAIGHEEPAQPSHAAQAAHPARAQRAPLHEAMVFGR